MNFILLTDYYYPSVKSGAIIVGDLTHELIQQGHQVTVVTFVNRQKKESQVTIEDKVKIIRIRTLTRSYGRLGRLLAERLYSSSIIKNIKCIENIDCDAVICYSPSIFYASAVRWLKTKYHSKAYLIIRDIFPKWALEAGLLKQGLLYKYFKFVEHDLYSSCNVIGIESKGDLEYFNNYGLDKSIKIEVLNSWGSIPHGINSNLSPNILDSSKVNIIYGGNMGDAQDLLSLINVIDYSLLGDRAVIVLIGSGNQYEKIKTSISRKKLTNVVLMPTLDRESYESIMSKADVGLVSLSNKMVSNNHPQKMRCYMKFSKPILASVNKNNEIIQMIIDNNIGLVSLASDEIEFNKNLDIMITNESMRKEQGENALTLFINKFTVEVATRQIIKNFQ
jgi:O26-antigen biosynthesis N-acetyl-L-fucosamine transferase